MNSTIGAIRELKDIPQPVTQMQSVPVAQPQSAQIPQVPQQPQFQPTQSGQVPIEPDMGDEIQALPVDNNPVSEADRKILTTFFTSSKGTKVLDEFKDAILGGIIFAILSVPEVNRRIDALISNKSPYILLAVKTCIFIVVFYLLKNMILKKKPH